MLMKQNSNKNRFLNITLSSVVILTAGLFGVLEAATLQQSYDKKYTTNSHNKTLFTKKVSGLNDEELDNFILGKSFFRIPWVEAPSATTARDGLGPLFGANTCITCHPNNGLAKKYTKNGSPSRGYVARLSIPSNHSKEHQKQLKYNGFVQEPTYGAQISLNGSKNVPFEAKPIISYEKKLIIYPDGEQITLSKPLHKHANKLYDLQYGELHPQTSITSRMAQALVGLGLLDQLSDEQILENQDIDDKNNDGISGKANIVYSPEFKDFRVGKFTWKASAPSVKHQVAAAANNDMGLTNPLFTNENCTSKQIECLNAPKGDNRRGMSEFDLTQERLDAITFYVSNLKIPKSTITQKDGEKIFKQIGCADCHKAEFTLKNGYKIKPFTDMLLHDMGEELSDGRAEFLATPTDWRTAPLWSIGKYHLALGEKPALLHDGRAKSVEEAILWHGGEALASKKSFMKLDKKQRKSLLSYIDEI